MCKSLLAFCFIPPPIQSRFLMWSRGLRFLKVRFFIWQLLLGCVSSMDRLVRKRTSLVGPFCCIIACFVGRWRKILIIFFGTVVMEGCVELILAGV